MNIVRKLEFSVLSVLILSIGSAYGADYKDNYVEDEIMPTKKPEYGEFEPLSDDPADYTGNPLDNPLVDFGDGNMILSESHEGNYSTVLATGDDAVEEALREQYERSKASDPEQDFSKQDATIAHFGGHLAMHRFMSSATQAQIADIHEKFGISSESLSSESGSVENGNLEKKKANN